MSRLRCGRINRANPIGFSGQRCHRSSLDLHKLPPGMENIVASALMRFDQELDTTLTHRFHVGQMVRLSGGFPLRNAVAGDYKVLSQLPSRDGELQYRIKSSREPYERVVKEGELEHA